MQPDPTRFCRTLRNAAFVCSQYRQTAKNEAVTKWIDSTMQELMALEFAIQEGQFIIFTSTES